MAREFWAGFHSYPAMVAALPLAVCVENRKAAARGQATVTVEQAREHLLDYVHAENFYIDRRFPNMGMARSWALRHIDQDVFGCVEVRVIERDDDDPSEWEAVEVWHSAGDEDGWYRADA